MSRLSDKYQVPQTAINNMIKDGVISCSWETYDQVYELKKQGKSVDEISDITHISRRHVYSILNRVK